MATSENNIRRTLYKSIEQEVSGSGEYIKLFKVENSSQYTIRVYVDILISANNTARFSLEVNNSTAADNYRIESYDISQGFKVELYKARVANSEDTYSISLKNSSNASVTSFQSIKVRKEIVYGYLTDADSVRTATSTGEKFCELSKSEAKHIIFGETQVKGDISIVGDIEQDGDTTLHGNIEQDGNVTQTGNKTITGDINQTGSLTHSGATTITQGDIRQTGDVSITNGSGKSTTITGAVTQSGNVSITGSTTIQNGNVTQTGDVSITNGSGKSTTITGNVTQTGNVSVSGTTSALNNFTSTGDVSVTKTTTAQNNFSSKDINVTETTNVSNVLNSKNTNTDTLNTSDYVAANNVVVNAQTTNTDTLNSAVGTQVINAQTTNAKTLNTDAFVTANPNINDQKGVIVNAETTNVKTLNKDKSNRTVNADTTNTKVLSNSGTISSTTTSTSVLNSSINGQTINATTTNAATLNTSINGQTINATTTNTATLNTSKTGKTINADTTNVATLESTNVNADTTNVVRLNENKTYSKNGTTISRVVNADTTNTATLNTSINGQVINANTTNTDVLNAEKGTKIIEANTARAATFNRTIDGQTIEATTIRAATLNSEKGERVIEATTTRAKTLNTSKGDNVIEATNVNAKTLNSSISGQTINATTANAAVLNADGTGKTINATNTKTQVLNTSIDDQTINAVSTNVSLLYSTNIDATNTNVETLNTAANRAGKVINADTTNADTLNTTTFVNSNAVTVNATTTNADTLNADGAGKTVNAGTTNAATLNTSINGQTINATTTNTATLNASKTGKTVNATTTNAATLNVSDTIASTTVSTGTLQNSGTISSTTTNTGTLNTSISGQVINAATTNAETLNQNATGKVVNANTTNVATLNTDPANKVVNADVTNTATLNASKTGKTVNANTTNVNVLNTDRLESNSALFATTADIDGNVTFENMIVNGSGIEGGQIKFKSSDGVEQVIKGIYNEALVKVTTGMTFKQEDGIPLVIGVSPTARGMNDNTILFEARTQANEYAIRVVYKAVAAGLIVVEELINNSSPTTVATLMVDGKYVVNGYTARFTSANTPINNDTLFTVQTVFQEIDELNNPTDVTIYKLQNDISTVANAGNMLLTANSLRQIMSIASLTSSSAVANLYKSDVTYTGGEKYFVYQSGTRDSLLGLWVKSSDGDGTYIPYLTKTSAGRYLATTATTATSLVLRDGSGNINANAMTLSSTLTANGNITAPKFILKNKLIPNGASSGSTIEKADSILMGDGNIKSWAGLVSAYQSYTDTAITNLLGENVPETLDTLKEIADWIGTEEGGAVQLAGRIATLESYFTNPESNIKSAIKAAKLDHSVSIWGQTTTFESGNPSTISGNMTGVGSITHSGNIVPTGNGTLTIGTGGENGKKYLAVYASNFYGTLTGSMSKAVTFSNTNGATIGSSYDGSANLTVSYATVGAAPTSHASVDTTYGSASTTHYGHVKVSNVRSDAIASTTGGTTSSRYYGVEMDKNGKTFVNIPWTDQHVDYIKNTTDKTYILSTNTAPTTSTQNITSVADDSIYVETNSSKRRLVAPYFTGNGSQLTNLTAANLTGNGTLPITVLPTSGVTAESYGPSEDATLVHNGTFTVPSFTVDKYGRLTAAGTKTYTLPTDNNTDTKVTQSYTTANEFYPLLMSSVKGVTSTSSRGAKTSYVNNQLYANPSTGTIYSTYLYALNMYKNGSEVATLEDVRNNISSMGDVLVFKGTKPYNDIIALTSALKGDVWLDATSGYEYVCTEAINGTANSAAWQQIGANGAVVVDAGYQVLRYAASRSTSISPTTGGSTSGRYYGVERTEGNGNKLFVNVPWTDTNTWRGINYKATSSSGSSTLLGNGTDTGSLTIAAGNNVSISGSGGVLTINSSYVNTTYTVGDDILDGNINANSSNQITFKPYTSQQSKLSFDTSNSNPSRTDRLNLNGHLYATKLYSGASEVVTQSNVSIDLATDSTTNEVTSAILKVGNKWIKFEAANDAITISFSTNGGSTWSA